MHDIFPPTTLLIQADWLVWCISVCMPVSELTFELIDIWPRYLSCWPTTWAKKSGEVGTCGSWDMRANRQTDRQTDSLLTDTFITIPRTDYTEAARLRGIRRTKPGWQSCQCKTAGERAVGLIARPLRACLHHHPCSRLLLRQVDTRAQQ